MAQVFRPSADTYFRLALLLIAVGAMGGLLFAGGVVRSDYLTRIGLSPEQPVPFSHEHHVGGLGLDCRYCHNQVEETASAGYPPTHTCMTCHSQIWTGASMLAPVRESLANNTPLRWNRVYDLPDFVYFNHSIHVAKGIGCTTCHGPIQTMKLTYRAQPLQMGWCLSCHRHPERQIRPRDRVFDTDWTPPPNQEVLGRKLVKEYGIDVGKLTHCYICHR